MVIGGGLKNELAERLGRGGFQATAIKAGSGDVGGGLG